MRAEVSSRLDEYLAPTSVEEAAQALSDGHGTVLAGGTDLMLQADNGRMPYRGRLVNIRRIGELHGIMVADGSMRIGALTTVTDILNDGLVRTNVPVLRQMADKFASDQIRNMATVGGNICNASPAGDMIVPLLALGAHVELASWRDGMLARREVALDGFFTGPGSTVRQENELLTAVSFALPPVGHVVSYAKSGPRPALEISAVSAALGATHADGALSNVRLALGAVAPTPIRMRRAEVLLEGAPLTDTLVEEAAQVAVSEARPIDDVRASAWYRMHLIRIFVRRLIRHVSQN